MSWFHKKSRIAVLQRLCATVQCRAITLTIRIEAAGSWRSGGIVVLVSFDVKLVLLVVNVVRESDGWLNLMSCRWFKWVWNKHTYVGFSIKKKMFDWNMHTYTGISIEKKISEKSGGLRGFSSPRHHLPKRWATHLRVHRSQNKYCIFYADILLIAEFPQPKSHTSNTVDKLNKSK